MVCVFHIKVIPLEQKLAVEWCCHLIQSCWLYCSRFLTWVGWHPNQKLLSLTRPDWNHTCALLASCIVRISDFKAVGEGTVGGPMPVSLEAFTVPEASLCVKGYVQLTSPHLVVIGVPWIAEWLHSWGGSIEVVSENQKGRIRNIWGGEGRRAHFRWDYSNTELRREFWEGTLGHLLLMAKDEVIWHPQGHTVVRLTLHTLDSSPWLSLGWKHTWYILPSLPMLEYLEQ